MKKFLTLMFLIVIIGSIGAVDTISFQYIDHLFQLRGRPDSPTIIDDVVIFTAPSSYRRVGIAFAHEGFGRVHYFRRFMIPNDNASPWINDRPPRDQYTDSRMLFYVYTIPETLNSDLEYRLIIDGLWVRDPLNPAYRTEPRSGITRSVIAIPYINRPDSPNRGPEGTLNFAFNAPPGEIVTVAGSFNGWDPFMYELLETSPGRYTLSIPLPAGTYQYAFFYRGERHLDTNNYRRVYTREGKAANEATVQ